MSKDIQLYGASKNNYTKKARSESHMHQRRVFFVNKCTLNPNKPFKKYWSFVILVLLLFTAVITPYTISYVDQADPAWDITMLVIDFVFALDILVNFVSAYHDPEGILITNRMGIMKHYVKT